MAARQIKSYLLSLSLIISSMGYAQTTGGPPQSGLPTSTTAPSSSIPGMTSTPLKQTPSRPAPAAQQQYIRRVPAQAATTPQAAGYFHPGIIVLREGQWQGADHLLNLSNQIGVYVEVVKPPNLGLSISAEDIQAGISAVFTQNRLSPVSLVQAGAAPLPFFHMKLFIYPVEKGYVVFCEARLFESVNLNRFTLATGMAFQAITWQRESLIVAPETRILDEVNKHIGEMVQSFITVYQSYEQRKGEVLK